MRVFAVLVVVAALACSGSSTGSGNVSPPATDAGTQTPPATDAGTQTPPATDAGTQTPPDTDAGTTVPPVTDAGEPDAGSPDAGAPDAGAPDAGAPDAGSSPTGAITPGSLGPAPFATSALTVFGAAQGLVEAPLSASVDEAGNLWAVSTTSLYLLKAGTTTFHRYTAADGLHVGPGYTEPPNITFVEGGKPDECFVGYYFHDTNVAKDGPTAHLWNDPAAHMGKMDQVLLQSDGTLKVNRYDFHNTNDGQFYESRTVTSMVYDHFQHPHNLYVGTNHGVTRVLPDKYILPTEQNGTTDNFQEKKFYGDHLHPVACWRGDCAAPTFGDFYGLTLADDGRLWMGGLASAGAVHFVDDLWNWMQSYVPINPFDPAIGYDSTQVIWNVPAMGDPVNLRGVAVTPDGTVWFASGEVESWRGTTYGMASLWNGKYSFFDPTRLGATEFNILELQALNDGRLVLGFPNSGLLVWTPGDTQGHRITTADGLPGESIGRMSLDKLHDPQILLVPTNGGLAAFSTVP